MWNIKEEHPLASFKYLNLYDEVLDIEWSPHCSTLFGTVCKDGRLELWDLTKNNMLDPFAYDNYPEENMANHPSKTAIKFCPGAPILVTGDIAGDTKVYRIHGYED